MEPLVAVCGTRSSANPDTCSRLRPIIRTFGQPSKTHISQNPRKPGTGTLPAKLHPISKAKRPTSGWRQGIVSERVALVTGSTSGIGLAIAQKFAQMNYSVALNSFEPADTWFGLVAELDRLGSGEIVYVQADLADAAASRALSDQVLSRFGRVDVLVNNAGVQKVSPIEQFEDADWQRIVAVSLDSAFHAIRSCLPGMTERGWGRIINIASAHGLRASPFKSAYVATKHAVVGLTKTVALEAAEKGVTVNAICPGYVWTPLVAKQVADQARVHGLSEEDVIRQVILAPQPTKQFVQPEEIAEMAAYLCSDWARSITGSTISIDGGWTAK
ncbi:3-hydroxybutyrate dehydrogenase [Devosia salina]|uniref:3-hydroxybutyrate dehydrogenase n=1 Tax=Devosia salina TaxID=2860336 RepID=A0ABX8WG12_9HYPH|nr:3-hydroxybutyrate dehydrogenase [Devosia salina]